MRGEAAPLTIDHPSLGILAHEASDRKLRDLEVIRHGTHLVLKDAPTKTIVRAQHIGHLNQFRENLDLVRSLIGAGAPLLGPLDPGIAWDDSVVITAWPLGAPTPDDTFGLATALKRLHSIEAPPNLATLNIDDRFQSRMDGLEADLGTAVTSDLHRRIDQAREAFNQYCSAHTHLLHADAHGGNLVTLDGSALLIDLDDLAVGPKEFDLVPSYTAYVRVHRNPARWGLFKKTYGADQADWDLVDRLRIIRETTMNTWLADVARHSTAAREQLEHRLATWDLDPLSHEPWRAV